MWFKKWQLGKGESGGDVYQDGMGIRLGRSDMVKISENSPIIAWRYSGDGGGNIVKDTVSKGTKRGSCGESFDRMPRTDLDNNPYPSCDSRYRITSADMDD